MTGTAAKLKIRPGMRIRTFNAPEGFESMLSPLPEGVSISSRTAGPGQVHWFVRTQKEVKEQVEKVLELVKEDVVLWTWFPKGSSGIKSDLTRDKGWEPLMQHDLQWLVLVSLDATWSGFAMRRKTGKSTARKTEKPDYSAFIDSTTKTVKLPAELAELFRKNQKQRQVFEGLSFSHKREYLEWVLSAKKEETRKTRLEKMMDMLAKGSRNPFDRG